MNLSPVDALHSLIALSLVIGYVVLAALGVDANALLAILPAYLVGAGVQRLAPTGSSGPG